MAKKSVNDPESLGWTDDGNGFWSWSGGGSGGGDDIWFRNAFIGPDQTLVSHLYCLADRSTTDPTFHYRLDPDQVILKVDKVQSTEYVDKNNNSIIGSGGSSLWEQNGNDIYYSDGNVGVGTDPASNLHVKDVGELRVDVSSGSYMQFWQDTTPTTAWSIGTQVPGQASGDSFHLGYYPDIGGWVDRLVINAAGNVGIGMAPTRSTFDISAKEQLKEWKTKAKKASWPVVTDGAFGQEPTEDLVAQWIETRAAGDKLQVDGNISANGSVQSNNGKIIAFKADGQYAMLDTTLPRASLVISEDGVDFSVLCESNGNISATGTVYGEKVSGSYLETRDGRVERWAHSGLNFTVNEILPSKSGVDTPDTISLGSSGAKFNNGHFAGTVSAGGDPWVAGTRLYGTGALYVGTTTSDADVFRGYDGATYTSSINNNGNATFSGTVNADVVAVGSGKINNQELVGSYQVMYPGVAGGGSWFWSGNEQGTYYLKAGGAWDSAVNLMSVTSNAVATFSGTVNAVEVRSEAFVNPNGYGVIVDSTGRLLPCIDPNLIIFDQSAITHTIGSNRDGFKFKEGHFSDAVYVNGSPLTTTRDLIETLSTLRAATQDETTLEGLRDSIGNAIGGLIEKFEAEIAAMPAPETGTMETLQ